MTCGCLKFERRKLFLLGQMASTDSAITTIGFAVVGCSIDRSMKILGFGLSRFSVLPLLGERAVEPTVDRGSAGDFDAAGAFSRR